MSVDKHIVICKHVKGNFLIWFSTSDELSMFAQNMGAVSAHAVQGAWKARSGRGGSEGVGEGSSGRGGSEGKGSGRLNTGYRV